VVEDSLVQQRVVAHLLRQMGHEVSVANEGFEALSAVRRDGKYDVIFMDCQMPLMDGIQSTRLIREIERLMGQKNYIVGVSATASADECIAAGMDEFMGKPLKKFVLETTLGRLIKEKSITHERAC
jgi:CheY-like chemotaxis protein